MTAKDNKRDQKGEDGEKKGEEGGRGCRIEKDILEGRKGRGEGGEAVTQVGRREKKTAEKR